jgi:hypothetical protein
MTVLNPSLYHALQQFGAVSVSAPEVPMQAIYTREPGGRIRMNVICSGEYYVLSCPYCHDTRGRLWVNHRWGVPDATTRTRNYWLAICFNENCLANEENRSDFIARTIWYQREARAGRVQLGAGRAENVGRPIPLPADYIRLDQLPEDHLARRYVLQRGFDPDELARDWGVGHSFACFTLSPCGRLLIPVCRLEQGKPVCWGWQSRSIEPNDETRYRYFTAPRLKKSHLLYGLERVDASTAPVLVCEGPTDCWRAGKNAVAVLGKHASEAQVRLIRKHLRGRPLVVALDPDAETTAEELLARIQGVRAGSILQPDDAPVAMLRLPDGRDPADCGRDELWALAERALR